MACRWKLCHLHCRTACLQIPAPPLCFALTGLETAQVSASYDAFLPPIAFIILVQLLYIECLPPVIFGPDYIKNKQTIELDSNI